MMTTMLTTNAASTVHPLDTLLVQQLTRLIQEEKSLVTKYPGLTSPVDAGEARVAFSKELGQLREKADRLQRMIDAMEHVGFRASRWADATPNLAA